jgi:hypothetical protein
MPSKPSGVDRSATLCLSSKTHSQCVSACVSMPATSFPSSFLSVSSMPFDIFLPSLPRALPAGLGR